MRQTAIADDKPPLLAHLWAKLPLLCGFACVGFFFWIVLARPVPPEARLLVEVAAAIGFVVGMISSASVLGGAALLEENSPNEPLRLREAGWIMGVPVGMAVGVILVATHGQPGANYFALFVRPIIVALALGEIVWASLTRVLMRRGGFTPDDYACGPFMGRGSYTPLARRKLAWRLAAKPQKLTVAQAKGYLPDIVPALAERLHRPGHEKETQHVLDLLGSLGQKTVAPALLEALESDRPQNRRSAATALGKLELLETVPQLAQHALEDPQPSVRRAAIVALGKLQDDLVLPTLLQAAGDKDGPSRQSACVALGKLKSDRAVPVLQTCLQDKDPQVRKSAANALEQITGTAPQVEDADEKK
jgi:hypothetical protein